MPGGVDPVLRFMVKFYMPDPSQLEEEYTRYNLMPCHADYQGDHVDDGEVLYAWTQSTLRRVQYVWFDDQNDHVRNCAHDGAADDDDDLFHQVPILTADQKGLGLGATAGEILKNWFQLKI